MARKKKKKRVDDVNASLDWEEPKGVEIPKTLSEMQRKILSDETKYWDDAKRLMWEELLEEEDEE